ncbi:MAG: sulfite exporter TauE/SafE family protein [Planctomycetota bacterium]
MIALLATVFTASLLGSLHCAGMCGPFCGVAVSGGRSRAEAAAMQLAYHGGRLVTYVVLGAAAGAVGALLNVASALAGIQPIALGLAGGVMVLVGVSEIARLRGWRVGWLGGFPLPKVWTALLRRGQQYAAARTGVPRALTIGLMTTFLPCGWLYAFLVTAAGSGGPLTGAAVMAVFWVGTVPILVSLGVSVRKLAGLLGERLPMATAVALVLVGVMTLSGRFQLSPTALAATVDAEAVAGETPDPTAKPACCRAAEAAR